MRATLVSACVAGLSVARVAGAASPKCPADTLWDGIACAHARATCGAWNGSTCEPELSLEHERALRTEFAQMDADASRICPEHDDATQAYQGTASEVLSTTDAAMKAAQAIHDRFEEFRRKVPAPAPAWTVATLAREGSIYDCIWTSLARATPVLFTAKQQAMLGRLQAVSAQLAATGHGAVSNSLQQSLVQTNQMTQVRWIELRGPYADVLSRKTVTAYVSAAVLARRYALEGFAFSRAHERLAALAGSLGPSRMAKILWSIPDPTDPEGRRHMQYVDGAFGP